MRRYNSNKAHQHEVDDMMDAMEETLYQHGVDAVFAGHVHAYESSYPVFRSCPSAPCFGKKVSYVDRTACPVSDGMGLSSSRTLVCM